MVIMLISLIMQELNLNFCHPNTTSHLQPLDCGIIKSFKSKFASNLINHVYNEFKGGKKIDQIKKEIKLNVAIKWVCKSWYEVQNETIVNCWRKSGLIQVNQVDELIVEENIDQIVTNLTNLSIYIPDLPTHVEFLQQLSINDSLFSTFDELN